MTTKDEQPAILQEIQTLAGKYFPESQERYARAVDLALEAFRLGLNTAEQRALTYQAQVIRTGKP